MRTLFISYAHADEGFVDRLYYDLCEAGIPAEYDKIILEIGDSIVEKISTTITDASGLIGVISPVSVASRWVQRELSWAMTGELSESRFRVFPAVIGECKVPIMLADKRYADFRGRYYPPLRDLIRGIQSFLEGMDCQPKSPNVYDNFLYVCSLIEDAIEQDDVVLLFNCLRQYPRVISTLTANTNDSAFAAPALAGLNVETTFVCWTMATVPLWHIVKLGPIVLGTDSQNSVWKLAEDAAELANSYKVHMNKFLYSCMLDSKDAELATLIDRMRQEDDLVKNKNADFRFKPVLDRTILLVGRRADHTNELVEIRNEIKKRFGVEVKSYEWIMDSLGGELYRRQAIE